MNEPIGATEREIGECHVRQILLMLLENDADVNAVDTAGNTPLHCAARWDASEMAWVLIHQGADPHIRNSAGETAADVADSCKAFVTAAVLRADVGNR